MDNVSAAAKGAAWRADRLPRKAQNNIFELLNILELFSFVFQILRIIFNVFAF
jgi:hypothetical protein